MSLVLEGLMFGLGLSLSLGPIFIALTQTSIEKGVLPGLTVGLGIWVSDVIIVWLFYHFINSIKDQIQSEAFQFWMGISGAVLLFAFGLFLILKKPVLDFSRKKWDYKNYLGFWTKGFMINTVNPFTFFFWMGVISTYVIGRSITGGEVLLFLGAILFMIIASDVAKVYLANYLRKKLEPKHIDGIGNFSGAILLCFGLFLAYQVW